MRWTEADFTEMSWHDNPVYGLRLVAPDPDRNDWRSEMMLDIDYIVEWICGTDGGVRFRVAPATLTFHDVTDLKLAADYGEYDHAATVNPMTIDGIMRTGIADPHSAVERPYWRWRVALNLPSDGEIALGASGFTQELRADPLETDQPWVPPERRT